MSQGSDGRFGAGNGAVAVDDQLAILGLAHRYARAVDTGDTAGAAALFAPEGVLTTPDPPRRMDPVTEHRGRAAIEAAVTMPAAIVGTFHAITGTVVEPGPDATTAEGRVTCVAHHIVADAEPARDFAWHIVYHDSYVRIGGVWRIARRELHLAHVLTLPVTMSRWT